MSVDVSPVSYPGRKRKSTKSVPPEEKKKKKNDPVVTSDDCDPVVREVVEDTRAAVEDMMKELNDMVEQSTPPPPPQFTLMTMFDNEVDYHQVKDNTMKERQWTIWYVLAITCVWRHVNLKKDGSM